MHWSIVMTRAKQPELSIIKSLYHYCSFTGYSESIFTKNEVYFSCPLSFNDPFDSQVRPFDKQKVDDSDLRNYLVRLKGKYKLSKRSIDIMMKSPKRKDVLKHIGHSFAESIGVYCLTEKRDNILMWSHYTNNHKGFCLEFKTKCEFFGKAQKIVYSREYPKFNFFKASQEKITEAMLLTKASDWSYEKEWRIINPLKGAGCQIYPNGSLAGIIMGCRIEEHNKKLLHKWLSRFGSTVKIYQAQQSKSAFALEIVELDN